MAPVKPHWKQPSHPAIQEVVINEAEYTSKSLSKVDLSPFGEYAKLAFPPCTIATEATYATVQFGKNKHLSLNSDLLYINHSCEPSLIFDTGNSRILAGPKGLRSGDELTFFYPSTEWEMAQPFDCRCGTPSCRKLVSGAKDMPPAKMEGTWLSGHIREMLDEQAAMARPVLTGSTDPTTDALKHAISQAEKGLEAARHALLVYISTSKIAFGSPEAAGQSVNGSDMQGSLANEVGMARQGPTSRELSGEMGGDTICA